MSATKLQNIGNIGVNNCVDLTWNDPCMFIYVECRDLVECFKLLYLGSDEEPQKSTLFKK